MKKFVKKVLLLIFVTLLFVSVVNFIYVRNCNNTDSLETERFHHVPDEIEICNVGSSYGLYDFNYKEYENKYRCFNFAMNNQYPSYDRRIIEYYKNHLKKDCIVLIPLSDALLFGKNNNFQSINNRYYRFLPAESIINYDLTTALLIKYFPSLNTDIEDLIDTLFHPKQNEFKDFDESIDDYWQKEINEDIAIEDIENRTGIRLLEDRNRYPQEIDEICNVINVCKENGAIPVLLVNPVCKDFYKIVEKMVPGFYQDHLDIINEIISRTGVDFYDYSDDERICEHYDLFRDSDHLNKNGAALYTKIIFDEVICKYK